MASTHQLLARASFVGLGSLLLMYGCGGPGDGPLKGGDAEWPNAPIPQPGGNGEPGGTGDGDTDGDPTTGAGSDTGGAWGDGDPGTGDGDGDPGGDGDGDPLTYPCLGSMDECGFELGICEAFPSTMLPDPPPAMTPACCVDADCMCLDGLCALPACSADGFCDCNCQFDEDPDCLPDSCAMPSHAPELDPVCPDTMDPIVLYMSNDDSNSQASPAFVRRTVNEGAIVPADRVRIHEFLNYYDLSYQNPEDEALDVGIQMRRTDEDHGIFTLLLYAQGQRMQPQERPPLNLVYTLDMSGSMSGEPIELLIDTVRATAGQLRAGDKISLLGWDTAQSILLDGYAVTGPDDPVLLGAIDQIAAGGGTDLHAGLVTGYDLANKHYIDGGINRVFLVSDGGANAGVTDIDLIAAEAADEDGEGIYLIGVGVSEASGYSDKLMNEVTDAGKGAYIFIDSEAEAERMFADPMRFLANTAIAARNVRMELTMPWYFGIKEFHGEEYSENPAEVEPQHLGVNDAMSFHQIVQSCDPEAPQNNDTITARATYVEPGTLMERTEEVTVSLYDLVHADASQLYKGDVIVNYAKAYIAIAAMINQGFEDDAIATAQAMADWMEQAAIALEDEEIDEMVDVMTTYHSTLVQLYGN